jgi:hypothetical protein
MVPTDDAVDEHVVPAFGEAVGDGDDRLHHGGVLGLGGRHPRLDVALDDPGEDVVRVEVDGPLPLAGEEAADGGLPGAGRAGDDDELAHGAPCVGPRCGTGGVWRSGTGRGEHGRGGRLAPDAGADEVGGHVDGVAQVDDDPLGVESPLELEDDGRVAVRADHERAGAADAGPDRADRVERHGQPAALEADGVDRAELDDEVVEAAVEVRSHASGRYGRVAGLPSAGRANRGRSSG